MENLKFYLCLFLIGILSSCSPEGPKDTITKERPHEPWVFRSVLDQQARMITIALDKDVWLAYNTETASLYKIWKGLVNFEGAVYDHAHGPQPTSVGDAYYLSDTLTQWSLQKNDRVVPSRIHYKGHRMVDEEVELMIEIEDIESGQQMSINERVQIQEKPNKKYLEWVITSGDFPETYKVIRHTSVASLVADQQLIRPSTFVIESSEPYDFDDRKFMKITGHQAIGPKEENRIMMQILEPTFIDPNLDDGFESQTGAFPSGAVLIAKNDCKICHNKDKKTVGPAYVSIAKKYEHNDASIALLTDKIKKGGTGIWGQQVMTPHPEIPNDDIQEMVNYIFSLADYEGVSTEQKKVMSMESPSISINDEDLIPGALTRIFNIRNTSTALPTNFDALKPIMAGIMPKFDNIYGSSFVGLGDWFALQAKGYFYMPADGIIHMRTWSDDGSKIKINGKTVIDNDGLHGTEMAETTLGLTKGYHPFELEFFQGAGGKFLSWNYKKDEEDSWQVVPPELIYHDKKDHKLIGNLSLPMTVVTKIPGNQSELIDVHPSFTLSQARPESFTPKVGGLDFLKDGRIVVSTWDNQGAVYLLDGLSQEDSEQISVKKIASGLAEPLGVKVVGDDIYVMQKQEMTHLVDTDGDEIIDEYRTLCDDWGVSANFHEFGFGLEEKDGYLYANLATGIMPGGAGMKNQHPDRGSCIRVNIKTGEMEKIANGLRTPNGVGRGFNDEIFVSDNQGDWLPSSKIMHVEKGDWFGSRAVDFNGTADFVEKKPVVWLPQDEIGNSPSTPGKLNVGPYKNQMIHGEVTHGGIKRVFVEEVGGQLQGALFRFTQGMEAGINRIQWGPDGALYAGGIGNPGNWQTTGLKWYGLQKLQYNEKVTFEMLAVRAKSDGLEIEFTEALAPGEGLSTDDYEIRQWYYEPTAEYGGPKLDDKALQVISVHPSDDRKKVFLEIAGIEPNHVVYINLKGQMVSVNDQSLWSTECWYTMNKIPQNDNGNRTNHAQNIIANSLTTVEAAAGWKLLFNGHSLDNWKGFKQDQVDSKWSATAGTLYFNPKANGKGGDIMTKDQYENFELRLEWKIQNCGNSGIFYNVVEDEKYCCTWQTGPEMQILDNTCHPDTKFPTHRAGDLYDMIECKYVTVNPAGEWNKVRIKSLNGQVEFWLNGYKNVTFTMHNDQWLDMIANSKFKDMPDFGLATKGHIALQDHGDQVWFRNIKIREL